MDGYSRRMLTLKSGREYRISDIVAVQKALASAGSALAKSTQALLDRWQINPNTKENSQWDTILTSQIDAIALLGHGNF